MKKIIIFYIFVLACCTRQFGSKEKEKGCGGNTSGLICCDISAVKKDQITENSVLIQRTVFCTDKNGIVHFYTY